MAIFSPEISAPYRNLYYSYEPESEAAWQDTLDRIRQGVAQQVTSRGLPVGRGAYASLVSRGISDAATERARRENENRLNYTRTMAGLPSSPSAVSQIGTPLLTGVGYGMGPALGKKLGENISQGAGSLWNMGTRPLTAAYEALRGPASAGYGALLTSPTSTVNPMDVGDVLAAQSIPENGSWLGDALSWVGSLFGW